MYKIRFLLLIYVLFSAEIYAQDFRNFGDLEVHSNAQLGLFNRTVNDGFFLGSGGLVGFYGENQYAIEGDQYLFLRDLEIANESAVLIMNPIFVAGNTNFIYGDLITDKENTLNFLEFENDAFYTGSTNMSKVNGWVRATFDSNFIFPVGDKDFLRPISVSSLGISTNYASAYFFNQNNSSEAMSIIDVEVASVLDWEYWQLNGDQPVNITLPWNERSQMTQFTDNHEKITIVGYHSQNLEWENLGEGLAIGNLTDGFVSSKSFTPNEYSYLAFGFLKAVDNRREIRDNENYYLSINGDGINDRLIFEELDGFPNNEVFIYDRNGLLVFQKENYNDEFTGMVGENMYAIDRESGLPQGIYFYLIKIPTERLEYQGFLYIDR